MTDQQQQLAPMPYRRGGDRKTTLPCEECGSETLRRYREQATGQTVSLCHWCIGIFNWRTAR